MLGSRTGVQLRTGIWKSLNHIFASLRDVLNVLGLVNIRASFDAIEAREEEVGRRSGAPF